MSTRRKLSELLDHLGGEEKLEAILLDFYGRMASDVLVGFFFHGRDFAAIAMKQKEFLLFAMGHRAHYDGKNPTNAHVGLAPILPGHFDRRLRILEDTLKTHNVADADIRTWIDFEASFRPVIEKTE